MSLLDVLQDVAFVVDLAQEFQQAHVAPPLCGFIQLNVGRLLLHPWMRGNDGHHGPAHEEHGLVLRGQEQPHLGLPGVEGEQRPSGGRIARAVIIHQLFARTIAELGQVGGGVLDHQPGALVDLDVLVTLEHVHDFRAVGAGAEPLVCGGMV